MKPSNLSQKITASPQPSKNILAEIVAHKRIEIETRKSLRPLEEFIDSVKPSTRSLKDALSHDYADFIFECKKASPSKGLIRANFDLVEILGDYRDFASAISILTDQKYFQGELAFLTIAREMVTQPILCKDFFIDPYQVYEARDYGADAILLMLSVLDDAQYRQLASLAKQLGLDVLTEVHDEAELQRALAMDVAIIGINNRDLKSLNVDLSVTERLVKNIPAGPIVISESGIENRRDVLRLSSQVDGFLIGSSIMAKPDIRHQVKSLIFGKVKICGITEEEDVVQVDRSGATYAGFIFYDQSPRYIEPAIALQIAKQANIRYVGVFVNQSPQTIAEIANQLKLFAVQLHGQESDSDIRQLRQKLPGTQIWKALRVANSIKFNRHPQVDRYLLDSFSAQQLGGSGETFDWQLLDNVDTSDLILAGGINVDNVISAANLCCYALDLSSGVELSPGIKSAAKIATIFNLLRA